jgi:N-acetylneuraminate synthase
MRTPPLVVAEVSANHHGSLSNALQLIRAISEAGATHVKFQTYTADTMTLDVDSPAFRIGDDHELWGGRSLYSLYQEAHTPWEWHAELFQESRQLGLVPFSSPFDMTAVDFLESLSPELYKVASMEIGDVPLIRRIAQTGRPMVISTGTATLDEVDDAVTAAQGAGCRDITLLLCTSSYPARPVDAHLERLAVLRERYGLPIGLSDHTMGTAVSVAATALGAVLIERHVTLRRADGGPDGFFSLEPEELTRLVNETRAAYEALGDRRWRTIESESTSRALKRSLYISQDCKAGDVLTPVNVRSIRPSGGLAPKHYDEIIGRRLRADAARGTPLTWDMLDSDTS